MASDAPQAPERPPRGRWDRFSAPQARWEWGQWVLTEDLVYQSRYGEIRVPAGFRTDLDSVPRLPLAFWLAKGRTVAAAIVHDFLYSEGKLHGLPIRRTVADRVFLEAMADEGVGWLARRTIWLGVRAGGWRAWGQYRRGALVATIEKAKAEGH